MYVNIRIFISVDFIFITTSSFRGGRQQLIYLLFVNLSSLLLPRVHIQVKFLQCTFCFCTVCVVLKQRFWRGSQCRRHIYLLVNENKVSNFQNKWCTVIGKALERRISILHLLKRNTIRRSPIFNHEKLNMASTLTKVLRWKEYVSLRSSLQSLRCIDPHGISTGAIVQCLSSFVRSSDLTEAVSAYSSLLKFYPFKSVFSSAGGLNFELICSQSLSHL